MEEKKFVDNRNKMEWAISEAKRETEKGHKDSTGCAIFMGRKLIALGHHEKARGNKPEKSAEVAAISQAFKNLETLDLSDCTLYTTGKPSLVSVDAAVQANIKHIYYASVTGNIDINLNESDNLREYVSEFYHDECAERLNR